MPEYKVLVTITTEKRFSVVAENYQTAMRCAEIGANVRNREEPVTSVEIVITEVKGGENG